MATIGKPNPSRVASSARGTENATELSTDNVLQARNSWQYWNATLDPFLKKYPNLPSTKVTAATGTSPLAETAPVMIVGAAKHWPENRHVATFICVAVASWYATYRYPSIIATAIPRPTSLTLLSIVDKVTEPHKPLHPAALRSPLAAS